MSLPLKERPGGMTVLVLDDEPVILVDLRFAMEDAGHTPVTVASAASALAKIEAGGIDAAVLDVNLGCGQTCEPVARRLQELGIPFLLHTGDLDRQGELVRELGGKVVPKPTPGPLVAMAVADLAAEHA